MYSDVLNQPSTKQAVTTTAVSSDVIDLLQNRDIGEGKKLIMAFCVTTAMAGGTSITFQVIGSASNTLSAPIVLGSSTAVPLASLGAGSITYVDFNSLYLSTGYRYIGVNYVVAGTFTSGNITATIVETVQDFKPYPSGFTVV